MQKRKEDVDKPKNTEGRDCGWMIPFLTKYQILLMKEDDENDSGDEDLKE